MFETLTTGIDGLDAILGSGIRYPEGTAAFLFITGETGTGKTLLGLELLTRAFWSDDHGGRTYLFYSVEQSPSDIHKKLEFDFGRYFGAPRPVRLVESDNPSKYCLEVDASSGGTNRLVLTHAHSALPAAKGFPIDIEWIQAEIGNYGRVEDVGMVCIDNVGLLLNDLEYFEKRAALLEARKLLMHNRIHGIFIQEESDGAMRFPSAEELSTDVLIRLGFEDSARFKSRSIEILKARHQYYYRGRHHFSIAGKGVNRSLYLGARSERGPGTHIYPSLAAQLSLARDESQLRVPPRGRDAIEIGPPEVREAYRNGTAPGRLSSTVVLAEPGTRYTGYALNWLARGAEVGKAGLLVSTKEDEDAILRICENRESLQPLLTAATPKAAASNADERRQLSPLFRLLYLHPEFLSAGKFTSDIIRMCEPGDPTQQGHPEPRIERLAFDNVHNLHRRFPLLEGQDFLIPALLDLLRYRSVTPLFIDHVPSSHETGELEMDPSQMLSTFDNVLHLFLRDKNGVPKNHVRILKSVGNDFDTRAFQVTL
ncbi:MAG: DUF2075 domain-containing protein [Planctomycetes bacterium]|nr:DUF2075 domain-containing protein [Planctomycetota bacterium]